MKSSGCPYFLSKSPKFKSYERKMVRCSNNLVGILNMVTLLISIPIIGGVIQLSKQVNIECEKFLEKLVIALGVFILFVSLAGIIVSSSRVTWLLWVSISSMLLEKIEGKVSFRS
ncbi:Tetraspanin-7 [Capsicum annuum]|uniref:Tetraspanin-7 n=1 Tax=Capsicum annuum TaxID=4072 RepID=A0A2G3AG10_CAPAN|nr:Tetraspanin-7 [Capsicum annuum]